MSWLEPVAAAYLGVSIELVGAVLLALGLTTRFAALPMLILSLVIQFSYRALDAHLSGRRCSAGTRCAGSARFRSMRS